MSLTQALVPVAGWAAGGPALASPAGNVLRGPEANRVPRELRQSLAIPTALIGEPAAGTSRSGTP